MRRRHGTPCPHRTIGRLLGLALLLPFGAGCASTPSGGTVDGAVTVYGEARYEDALTLATEAMRTPNATDRADAAYIAGLAAYRMGDTDEAERRLLKAVDAPDATTAAKARAMLALVRLDQHRPREAAELFQKAVTDLPPEDAVHARRYGGAAAREAGLTDSFSTTLADDAVFDEMEVSDGSFTLQVGAFRERKRARSAAAAAEPRTVAAGIGRPRVLSRADAARRTMFVVQVGRFETRGAAAGMRAHLGLPHAIVVPRLDGSSVSAAP
jgi:hypothetical protein